MLGEEFLPERVLVRVLRMHADDIDRLIAAFHDQFVDLVPVGGKDGCVVGGVRYFRLCRPPFQQDACICK